MSTKQRRTLVLITTKDRIKGLSVTLENNLEQITSFAVAKPERKKLISNCKDAIESIKIELQTIEAVLDN